jgi:hypothetical protein
MLKWAAMELIVLLSDVLSSPDTALAPVSAAAQHGALVVWLWRCALKQIQYYGVVRCCLRIVHMLEESYVYF